MALISPIAQLAVPQARATIGRVLPEPRCSARALAASGAVTLVLCRQRSQHGQAALGRRVSGLVTSASDLQSNTARSSMPSSLGDLLDPARQEFLDEDEEAERRDKLEEEEQVMEVSRMWSEGVWGAAWGPAGPAFPAMTPKASRRRRQLKTPTMTPVYSNLRFDGLTRQTLLRVVLPTMIGFIGGFASFAPICTLLQDLLDVGNTGQGPILSLLALDQSQFMQNFLTVNGLLFTILCGNTYTSLYNQQEMLFHALFVEVSEAKSLLEQSCLICQGRPFYPKVLESIGDYVATDLRRLDVEPAELLASRPMDDPLEYILYATSVGVPSVIYDTVRDLRQARGQRLGAMQRKLPLIHFVLLYVLGFLELFAFPLLGAGTVSVATDDKILTIQAIFFGSMCGAIVMTLQVIYELWKPFGGAYTVDTALETMVQGLEEELRVRQQMWRPHETSEDSFNTGAHMVDR